MGDHGVSAARWKAIGASVLGVSHTAHGVPCQDFHIIEKIRLPSEQELLLAAVSDGAGSAQHSEIGARVACSAVIAAARRYFEEGGSLSNASEAIVSGWFTEAADAVAVAAEQRAADLGDFAATLLFAAVDDDRAAFAQVGDGAVVATDAVDEEVSFNLVLQPTRGEYANETVFITSRGWRDEMQYRLFDATILDVALMSDGVEKLAIDFRRRRPHGPFFSMIFRPIWADMANQDEEGITNIRQGLESFLASEVVNRRTDDDKTIVLATRRWVGSAFSDS